MAVQRRLDELKAECERLGIKVTEFRKKKEGKHDYVKALQQFNLKQRYPDGNLPKALAYMLAMESPMLCFRLPDMPEDFQQKVWDDPEWVAQTKINGCRMLVHFDVVEGIKFFSRNLSLTDYLPVEYDNIWLKNFNPKTLIDAGVTNFIMDSEVLCPVTKVDTSKKLMSSGGVVTETNLQATAALIALNREDSLRIQKDNDIQLEFHGFHVLEINGQDFRQMPWDQMSAVLEILQGKLVTAGFNVKPVMTVGGSDKKAFFTAITERGGEGVVLKWLKSTYHATESRHHKVWIKVKRQLSHGTDAGGLGDTIDGFVTGFIKGSDGSGYEHLVGSLEISLYLKLENGETIQHHIASVPPGTLEMRKSLTVIGPNGEVQLRPDVYNKVVEVDGNWVSAKARRLMHARFVGFRPDRSPETCIMDETTLKRMII